MTLFTLEVVTIAVRIGLGMGMFSSRRKARAEAEAQKALERTLREVPLSCRGSGHSYAKFATGYQCSKCGNFVSTREGELYGLANEGRVDRRRGPR